MLAYMVWLSLSNYFFTVLWLNLAFVIDPLFQGLGLLKWASSLWEEMQQLEMERLQKIELAVAGSEVEGLYGLLRGGMSYFPMSSAPPPPTKCCPAPTATISKLPPQESKGVEPKVPTPVNGGLNWHQRLPPQLSPKLLRWPSPTTWHPFACRWGNQ